VGVCHCLELLITLTRLWYNQIIICYFMWCDILETHTTVFFLSMTSLSRVGDLLRRAVQELEATQGSRNEASSASTSSESDRRQNLSELRQLFAPYRRSRPQLSQVKTTIQTRTTWTHKFCCLSSPSQVRKVAKSNPV
jgi:hypothetical protein